MTSNHSPAPGIEPLRRRGELAEANPTPFRALDISLPGGGHEEAIQSPEAFGQAVTGGHAR
jgi:hypothetical protein